MFICLEASLVKSGMTYEMTRVPTPTEFRICGRSRMLEGRESPKITRVSEVFPSVQVHVVGGVAYFIRDYGSIVTLCRLNLMRRLFHGSMDRRSTLYPNFWPDFDDESTFIVEPFTRWQLCYGIDDDLKRHSCFQCVK